ncbi:MAG: hypothetical protein II362_06735 [Alistipes sp.]|nr:hypothetical protein [Alistipes sp.]
MKRIILAIAALMLLSPATAQIRIGKRGQLAASLESNSIYYVDDSKIGEEPTEEFGSHNFLKLDYTLGRFSVGVQGNAFLPVQLGYTDLGYGDCKFFLSKYIQWADKNYEVLVGDVYDQFGNGLIFRSYEDRQLGINNSIEGGRIVGRLGKWAQIKALGGRQRLNTKYSDTWVMGADLSLSLADMFRMEETLLSVEGSFVNRLESLDEDPMLDELLEEMGQEKNVQLYSGRLNFGYKGFTLRGEYAAKGKDMINSTAMSAEKGSALLGEIGYSHGNFSATGTFRRLEHMGTHISIYNAGINNTLNYLPALTRQYTYMLANLNPYQVSVEGELGGQVDLAYSLRSTESRYRYWNFHLNYSTYYTLNENQTSTGDRNLLWQDLNFDVERQWSKKLKTTFLFSRQEWNESHGWEDETYVSNIFVGDVTYKFNRKHSLRVEAQYLLSDDYEGDWVAGLVEYSFAPMWSFYFSDMYNLGETDTNYYNGGVSWSKNRTRLQLSYGRNRAGYICSGGVCRYSPAYTGVNFMLTTSF